MNNIIEIFKSIQGEGNYIGIPSIFIRFGKCNLICPHCDTKYSWEEEGKYSVNDALKYIRENNKYSHIVITGGEPLLYQDNLTTLVGEIDKKITIETNGTIKPNGLLVSFMYDNLWSVLPKLYLWSTTPLLTQKDT